MDQGLPLRTQEEFGFFRVLEKCLEQHGFKAADALAAKTVTRARRIIEATEEWRSTLIAKVTFPKLNWSASCGPADSNDIKKQTTLEGFRDRPREDLGNELCDRCWGTIGLIGSLHPNPLTERSALLCQIHLEA